VGLQSEVCRKADIGVKCVTREVDYTRSTPFPGRSISLTAASASSA
jgi:hypothetical protein